jgi:hypothetical protein
MDTDTDGTTALRDTSTLCNRDMCKELQFDRDTTRRILYLPGSYSSLRSN